MKVYGKTNIFSGNVLSDISEVANIPQNILAVEDLSQYDTSGLDPEILIIDKKTKTLNSTVNSQNSWSNATHILEDQEFSEDIYYIASLYRRLFDNNSSNYLSISADLFNFGDVGSPIDFVIDFSMYFEGSLSPGTILYNGLNTGQVDLEQNKNFLLTTSGVRLDKSINYQDPPSVVQYRSDNYLYLMRPFIQSNFQLSVNRIYHVAIIRSGDTTYLALNGQIQGSAPSVDYFYYDLVKLGAGYYGANGSYIWNFRVLKGNDRGWTIDFTPPNYNHNNDTDCDFILNSNNLIDLRGNYDVTIHGSEPILDESWVQPLYVDIVTYKQYNIYPYLSNKDINIILPNVSSVTSLNVNFKLLHSCEFINFQAIDDTNINTGETETYYPTAKIHYDAFDFDYPIRFIYGNGEWVQRFADKEYNVKTLSVIPSVPNNQFPFASSHPYLTLYPNYETKTFNSYTGSQKYSNVKYIDDHPWSNVFPVLDLTGFGIYNYASSNYSVSGYEIEMIARFVGNPTSEYFLDTYGSYTNVTDTDNGRYTSSVTLRHGLSVTSDRRFFLKAVRRYYRYYDTAGYFSHNDNFTDYYQVNSDTTPSFDLNVWYRFVFNIRRYDFSNRLYFDFNITVQDLINNNVIYNGHEYDTIYYWPAYDLKEYSSYDKIVRNDGYLLIPRMIYGQPIQIIMLRCDNISRSGPGIKTYDFNTISGFKNV